MRVKALTVQSSQLARDGTLHNYRFEIVFDDLPRKLKKYPRQAQSLT